MNPREIEFLEKEKGHLKSFSKGSYEYIELLINRSNFSSDELISKLIEVRDTAHEIADIVGDKAGRKAGKKASKTFDSTACVSAGIIAFLKTFFIFAIPLGIFVFCCFVLLKLFLAIPLMIAQYRTETIKLAIMNAVENGSFQRSEVPINPTDGSAPRPIDVPPRINP